MNNREIISYCHLSFINGITDALSVIILHKMFVVLMTGNIIFFIADLGTGFLFKDIVRLSLIINMIICEIIIHKYIDKISKNKRFLMSILLVCIYVFLGNYFFKNHSIGENNFHFLIVANIATITSLSINNIFYRFHRTKSNLVLYTVNLLKLGDMVVDKNIKELKLIVSTLLFFILGLLLAAFTVLKVNFLIFLVTIPVLISLYIVNLKNIN